MKPRCTQLVGLLADYVEHQLPPDVHQELERHPALRTALPFLRNANCWRHNYMSACARSGGGFSSGRSPGGMGAAA